MPSDWRVTLDKNKHLRKFDNWPQLDENSLRPSERKAFNRNRAIVMSVLSGQKLKDSVKPFGLNPSYATYLMNRCLKSSEFEEPALTQALRPNFRTSDNIRIKPLTENKSSGARGSFKKILSDHPEIKNRLDEALLAFVKRTKNSQNLTKSIFHRMFLRELEKLNWPQTRYPFDQLNRAYTTCGIYFDKRVQELQMVKEAPLRPPFERISHLKIFDEIEIDEQTNDNFTSVDIDFGNSYKPLRVARISAALAIDVESDAILGYQLCLTAHPSHEDILALFDTIRCEWVPRKIKTKGIRYLKGAAFPSGVNPIFSNCMFGTIKLDNALAHHANRIKSYVCEDLGGTINYGLPANPKSRNFVEYAFRRLNDLSHRSSSTTGSNPASKIRETSINSKSPPPVKLHEFEEMLEVVLAGHNCTPQIRLKGSTPLEVLQHQIEEFPIPICYSNLHREKKR